MYYNNKIKIIIRLLSIIAMLCVFLNDIFRFGINIAFIFIGLQQLLFAYNSYKLKREKQEIYTSVLVGMFIISSSIISYLMRQ